MREEKEDERMEFGINTVKLVQSDVP